MSRWARARGRVRRVSRACARDPARPGRTSDRPGPHSAQATARGRVKPKQAARRVGVVTQSKRETGTRRPAHRAAIFVL